MKRLVVYNVSKAGCVYFVYYAIMHKCDIIKNGQLTGYLYDSDRKAMIAGLTEQMTMIKYTENAEWNGEFSGNFDG